MRYLSLFLSTVLLVPMVANCQTSTTPPAKETSPIEQPKADVGGTAKLSDASLKYECKNGKNSRKIEIAFDNAATKTPCRVQYTKETENPGVVQTLWNADNDFNYCEEKASAFVSKLEGMGWTCTGL